MKFEDLLSEYERKLDYVRRMTVPDTLSCYHKTKEYWEGYLRGTFDWFENMKYECEDFNPQIRKITDEDVQKYKYTTSKNDGCGVEWPLCGVLEYRQESIPIYDDDYGQQTFMVYRGEMVPGGVYNCGCEYDFCYAIDEIRDLCFENKTEFYNR